MGSYKGTAIILYNFHEPVLILFFYTVLMLKAWNKFIYKQV